MTILNNSIASTDRLARAAKRHIHCLFMALPKTLTHKEMMSIALRMEEVDASYDLEFLFKFAAELEAFDLDETIIAREMALTQSPF